MSLPIATVSSVDAAEVRDGFSLAGRSSKPSVSIVVPAYNEAEIVVGNLERLCSYLEGLRDHYDWELLLVNDGSTDGSGELATEFAARRSNVRVLHHLRNFGLGQALRFAFQQSRGEYIVTLDIDLTYAPEHIPRLLETMIATRAKVVIASPYMPGGQISHIPPFRRTLSKSANRFLSFSAKGHLSTLTGMVRAYDGPFIRSLDLRSMGMEINPEIIYKASLLGARIEEVPAHLNWGESKKVAKGRRSSMKILRHTMAIIFSGFLFRPFLFFILPGALLLLFSLYVNSWMVHHFIRHYQEMTQYSWFLNRASAAVEAAYQQAPHTFIVGLFALTLAIQLLGLGIVALQSTTYFEELFHLGTTIHRNQKEEFN